MHSLALYTIRINDLSLPGPREDRFHKLNQVRGRDLLALIQAFTSANATSSYKTVVFGKFTRAYKFRDVVLKGRTLHGVMDYGEYGAKGKIDNVKNGATKYKKASTDSDIRELYFCFKIPAGAKTGVCAFHSINTIGVKSLLTSELQDSLSAVLNGLRIRIDPATYDEVARDWANSAEVKSLRLTKYHPRSQSSDLIDSLGEHTTEVIYKPRGRNGSFGPLKDLIKIKNGVQLPSALVTGLGQECQSVKAVVELNGRRRTFKLSASETPISVIELDEGDIDMDDGVPLIPSLHKYASSLLDDMLTSI